MHCLSPQGLPRERLGLGVQAGTPEIGELKRRLWQARGDGKRQLGTRCNRLAALSGTKLFCLSASGAICLHAALGLLVASSCGAAERDVGFLVQLLWERGAAR